MQGWTGTQIGLLDYVAPELILPDHIKQPVQRPDWLTSEQVMQLLKLTKHKTLVLHHWWNTDISVALSCRMLAEFFRSGRGTSTRYRLSLPDRKHVVTTSECIEHKVYAEPYLYEWMYDHERMGYPNVGYHYRFEFITQEKFIIQAKSYLHVEYEGAGMKGHAVFMNEAGYSNPKKKRTMLVDAHHYTL